MFRFKKIIIALIFLFISFESYASSGDVKFAEDSNYQWNVRFNMEVTPETFEKDSITVSDAIGNMIEVKIERGTDKNSVKIVPLKPYQYGREYMITVHKNKVYAGSKVLKKDHHQQFITTPESTLKHAQYLYDNAVEGTGHGDSYYRSKPLLKMAIDTAYNKLLRLSTSTNINENQERYNISKELGDAIDRFIIGRTSYDLGLVTPNKNVQNPVSISFKYSFLKKSKERIVSDLKGFMVAIYDKDGVFKSSDFVSKEKRTNGLLEDNTGVPETDQSYYYLYENIDITNALLGLEPGEYTVKIKPSFESQSDTWIEYSDASSFMIVYQTEESLPLARFLPWFNLLELEDKKNIDRYELSILVGDEVKKFSFDREDLEIRDTTANNYTMRYYKNNGKRFLPLSRYDYLMDIFSSAKSLDVRGYDKKNQLVYLSENPIKINFETKDLPKITAAYNLTNQQKYIVFNQNDPERPKDIETLPVKIGDELAIETNCKDLIFLKLKDKTPQYVPYDDLEVTMRKLRYATEKFGGATEENYGYYEAFKSEVNNRIEKNVLFTKILPLTTEEKEYDGNKLQMVKTDKLEDGEYVILAKKRVRSGGELYFPLEKVVFKVYSDGFGVEIDNISSKGINFKTKAVNYEYRAYVVSEYDYFNFLNDPREDFIIDLISQGKVWSNPCSGIGNGEIRDVLTFKSEPPDGIYYLVLFNDRYRQGEVTQHSIAMFNYQR